MINLAIKHGIQLTVAVLTICVLGIMAALNLPVQMIPDLDVRTISVRTSWPGATPQDVEKEILIQQEDYLRTITGMRRMISTASTGSATVELEFPFGTDISDALIRVNNALSQVPDYPENVDEPRLYATSFSSNAFMFFRIEPMPGQNIELDMVRLRDFVVDNIQTRMERVPGVSEVNVRSGAERQVQIRIDPHRLAATGVTLNQVRQAVRDRNRDSSAGDLDQGKRRFLLRTVGRFSSVEDLEALIIARRGDAIIRLSDVGEVSLEHFELRRHTFVNGKSTINMSVRKEAGSNVIDIKEAMMPTVDSINRDVLSPMGLQMTLISDDVRYVKASIENVWTNLLIGAALATTIMLLFLRSFSATMVGVVGIPVCTIAAFLGLGLGGRTINVISLAGVAFAIGMTLDNSIVVLESIERYRRRGLGRFAAAKAGLMRVWPAVLASTLTTVIVFAPVMMIKEEAGQLFSDIAIAISASIIASMLVAITVVPSAAARVPLAGGNKEHGLAAAFGRGFSRIVLGFIGWLANGSVRAFVTVATIMAGAAAVLLYLTPPAGYLPEGEEAKIFTVMVPPAGYNLGEMSEIGKGLHAELVPNIQADPGRFQRGETDIPPLAWIYLVVNPDRIFIVSETVDPALIDDLRVALNNRVKSLPAMRGFSARGSIISSNDGGSRSVNVDIAGTELQTIYETANTVYRRAKDVLDEPEIGSDPRSLSLAQPLVELRPEWTRAAESGFTAGELGFAIAALTDGAFIDEMILDDDLVDIFVYSSRGTGQTLDNLPLLPLATPLGDVIPVGTVADIVETVDTDTIRRLDGRRTVTLNIIPASTVPLETAVNIVQSEVVTHLKESGEVPPGVTLDISGASDQLDKTRKALSSNFVVAIILVYLLLAAILSHWALPLIIITTVPIGLAGGIVGLFLLNSVGATLPAWGLAAVHQPFDMITMLGFVILLGTVVNNPILIVDETLHQFRREGLAPGPAVREAVAMRLRPMMMSTATTVFGIAPLVLIPGAGTELYRGVGAIVLFGLLFATLVTLVFLPPLLALMLRLFGRRQSQPEQAVPVSAE